MNITGLLAMLLALAAAPGAMAQGPAGEPPSAMVFKAFPHGDGPLSAMMAFIPVGQLAEFDKPYEQAPQITPIGAAKVGDVVAVKIMFAGPQISADGFIDITYDLKVTGPDGATYDDTDLKGLEAIRLKVDKAEGVFDNRVAVVAVRFEVKDPPGVYTASAVLHDNIGDRHIPLTAQITLNK